jgi:hypothetical protein
MILLRTNSLVELKRVGAACEICGMIFVNLSDGEVFAHEHPAVCHNCWKELSGIEKRMYKRANKNTVTR